MLVAIYNVEDTERLRARRLTINTPRITIGRDPSCTVVVEDDPRVIEFHLEIRVNAKDYVVTPRGTTSVNGNVITTATTCASGDTLLLGNTVVKLRPEQNLVKTLSRPVDSRAVPAPSAPSAPSPPSTWERDEVTPQVGNPVERPQVIRMPANPPMPMYNPPRPQPYGPYMPTQMPAPAKVFRQRLSKDAAEHALLVTLRARPDDPGARMVYADWLEDHGFLVRAQITRGAEPEIGPVLDESTADWRAIASCTTLYDCFRDDCPRLWSRFAAVADDERVRTCTTCTRLVRYCVHALDPQGAISRGEGAVLDTAVVSDDIDAGDTLDDPPRR